ncbi:MAG TPA: SagB family peptide dehydrogenase [Thermoanaerobaculia bacterium]|nr:SagB family peptide dehydrogenase [Thermoanaerobaculia bacterium]
MPSPVLSLPPDFRLVPSSGGLAIERGRFHLPLGLPLGEMGPELRAALERLASGGATEEELLGRVQGLELLRLHQLLADLAERRLLCRTLQRGGEPAITVVPFSRSAPEPRGSAPDRLVLSRFACLRREGSSWVAESPLAHSYLIVHGAGAPLLSRLAASLERDGLEAEERGWIDLLWEEGFLAAPEEGEDPDLASWEFHDLLFHARSRSGRHRNRYGGTYPFRGQIEPLPALKAPMSGETVDLHRPDLERLIQEDLPFTRVLEERRSRREPGERPVSARELGEFLYRSSRVREVRTTATHEISDRPYPGGGALYELEIYPAVNRCEGLDAGLYHYDPRNHRLERLTGMTPETRALTEAAGAMAEAPPPDVLLVLAARFRRVTWKYRSMAYAGILKNAGALYQTMYLVAAAMGLSACALGGGDADLFARAAGTRWEAETSVGELILNRSSSPR